LLAQVSAQYNANRRSYESAVDEQQSAMEKAAQDLAAAREIKVKLEQVLPHYREQEMAFAELSRTGDIARLTAEDKRRERIEREQDLRSQEHIIRSSGAVMAQARKRLQQLTADYRQQLQTERVARAGELAQITQELAKQEHRQGLQELRAPQSGVVKDLATHTAGTVVSPGTILMTLVPNHEALCAEVWVANDDIGFIRPGQQVKVKISSFTFQKYGMLDGEVLQVSADASDGGNGGAAERRDTTGGSEKGLAYKTLVKLSRQQLLSEGISRPLAPGMQVAAEIKLGTRTVLEYLFSPVTKAFHEAGRER
jgi:hemolysin D